MSHIIGNRSLDANTGESSYVFNHVVSKESEAASLPSVFAAQLKAEKSRKETEFDSEFPEVMVKMKSSTASVSVNHESVEKGGLSSYYGGDVKESIREDLYTFYGGNQSVMESPSIVNGLEAASSHAYPLTGSNFSLLNVNTAIKKVELSAQPSLQSTGYAIKSIYLIFNCYVQYSVYLFKF